MNSDFFLLGTLFVLILLIVKMSYENSDLNLTLSIDNIISNSKYNKVRGIYNIIINKMQINNNPIVLKDKIKKNVFIIGLAWIFLFTAFQSMANLQSSLNKDEGLGTAALSTIYITLVVSSMFLPPVLVDRYGAKWTIVLCQFG